MCVGFFCLFFCVCGLFFLIGFPPDVFPTFSLERMLLFIVTIIFNTICKRYFEFVEISTFISLFVLLYLFIDY